MFEGKNIMQESCRNRGMQEDWTGIDKSRREKWKQSGWREVEGKWKRSWVREATQEKPEKEEKSTFRKGQGKNKFHNQSAVRTCHDGYLRRSMLIQRPFMDKYCF